MPVSSRKAEGEPRHRKIRDPHKNLVIHLPFRRPSSGRLLRRFHVCFQQARTSIGLCQGFPTALKESLFTNAGLPSIIDAFLSGFPHHREGAKSMRRLIVVFSVVSFAVALWACSTAYEAKPLPFKVPTAYSNATEVAETLVGAQAFVDPAEAKEAFGFDIRAAGMLPVQVAFENNGSRSLGINPSQTFLEDDAGNLWPLLSTEMAYERATKFAQTKQVFKEAGYHGFLGAAAGAVIGAAVGIVGGRDVAGNIGKGAAVGAAAGSTLGGLKGYASSDARRAIVDDLNRKNLQNKAIEPRGLAFGFLFFPGEAISARQLRLQLTEADTKKTHVVKLDLISHGAR